MNRSELIARFIEANPGVGTAAISCGLNMPTTTVASNIKKLEQLNILNIEKQGNKHMYSIIPGIILHEVLPDSTLLNVGSEIEKIKCSAEKLAARKWYRRAATEIGKAIPLLYSSCDKRQIIELKNKYWRMAERPRHGGAA